MYLLLISCCKDEKGCDVIDVMRCIVYVFQFLDFELVKGDLNEKVVFVVIQGLLYLDFVDLEDFIKVNKIQVVNKIVYYYNDDMFLIMRRCFVFIN